MWAVASSRSKSQFARLFPSFELELCKHRLKHKKLKIIKDRRDMGILLISFMQNNVNSLDNPPYYLIILSFHRIILTSFLSFSFLRSASLRYSSW